MYTSRACVCGLFYTIGNLLIVLLHVFLNTKSKRCSSNARFSSACFCRVLSWSSIKTCSAAFKSASFSLTYHLQHNKVVQSQHIEHTFCTNIARMCSSLECISFKCSLRFCWYVSSKLKTKQLITWTARQLTLPNRFVVSGNI